MTTTRPITTYGNWRKPQRPGVLGLGVLGTLGLLVGCIFTVLLWATSGWVPAVIWLVALFMALSLIGMRDAHGLSLLTRISGAVVWQQAKRQRTHVYRSGMLSRIPGQRNILPGLAAATTLHEFTDSTGRRCAMLRMPRAGHYSLIFACEPDGAALVDQPQIDRWVAQFGGWLGQLSGEPGLVGASVVIETAPESGARLRQEIDRRLDPDAPPLAVDMLEEIKATYAASSAMLRGWVTVTFNAAVRPGGPKRSPKAMVRDLAPRVPNLLHGLEGTGAGAVRPVSHQEVCEVVRVSYEPSLHLAIEDARARGQMPTLAWSDVGPVAAQATWESYRHDSGVSTSWAMTVPPRGEILEVTLKDLLAPHPDIDRKRVAIHYRPWDPGRSAARVEFDRRAANMQLNASDRIPSARAMQQQAQAEATAREEAAGATLLDFSVAVTATVTDPDRLPQARAAIDMSSGRSRLLLRPMRGCQDVGFLATLPLGFILPAYVAVPDFFKETV